MKNCSWPWFSSSQTGMYLKCSGIKKHSIIWHTFELWCVCVCQSLSCVWLFTTPWTVVRQAPLSMEFSRQQYWSGLLFPAPGDLPDPVIKPRSPALQADSLQSEPPGKPQSTPRYFPGQRDWFCRSPISSKLSIFAWRLWEAKFFFPHCHKGVI